MLFNVHSAYSFLNSTIKLEDYVTVAKQSGYESLGLADLNVMHGCLTFYRLAKSQGLKPLIGMTANFSGLITRDQMFSCILYALDYQGYLALIQISKSLNLPVINTQAILNVLTINADHLVMITPGRQGEIEQAILHGNLDQAQAVLAQWMTYLPLNNIYLGIPIYPYNPIECQNLVDFGRQAGLKMVTNQLVETLTSGEAFSLKLLQAIENNEVLDPSIKDYRGVHFLYPKDALERLYQEQKLTFVLEENQRLIDRIQVDLPLNQSLLPKFVAPDGKNSADYLRELCQDRLKSLEKDHLPEYQERLAHELNIIAKMGFVDYFLIVWEIMSYCRKAKIRTGPGRGSAAGSLVAYLLSITLVDPVEYDLLFERFLNPERYNMPDIDIDIPDDKRDQVLHYIEKRYGHQQVAQMITYGKFKSKQAIRDTLRVLGQERKVQDTWSRAIPNELNMTLEEAYEKSQALRLIVDDNPLNQEIFQVAKTLEGLPRHSSVHASGVVICDQDLSELIPIIERPNLLQLTQYDMGDVERVGLLKMDFLGLRNLQVLDEVLQVIREVYQEDIDINTIPNNDPASLALFCQANTSGVFQFESKGIRQVLKRLKPESFEDVVAVNALYRPGPMQQISTYIKRKHGQEPIEIIDPIIEPILRKTYGIIVYQEQVMQICQVMAGFSLGQADLLRRAMGKKQVAIMEQEKEHFIKGAAEKGVGQETALKVYQYIYQFANYGFNRAHAVVYSRLAYQLAYLKSHYPLAFYQVLLNQGNSQQTSHEEYIREAKQEIGSLLTVSVNASGIDYLIEGQRLRMGLSAIKGLRRDFISEIVSQRQQGGLYQDYKDFLSRLSAHQLKPEPIQALIDAGALDDLGYNRATLTHNLDRFLQYFLLTGNQLTLLQEIVPKMDIKEEWSKRERIRRQQEVLGFDLAGHPMDDFLPLIRESRDYLPLEEIQELSSRSLVVTLVYIESLRMIQTKRGEAMAFLKVTDGQSAMQVVAFPEAFQKYQAFMQEGQIVELRARRETDRQGQIQLVAIKFDNPPHPQQIKEQNNQALQQAVSTIFIRVIQSSVKDQQFQALEALALANPGPLKIVMVDEQKRTWQLDDRYNISMAQRIQEDLVQIFGRDNVAYR